MQDLVQVGLDGDADARISGTVSSSSSSSSDGAVKLDSHSSATKATFAPPDPTSLDISTLIMTDEAQDDANLEGMGIILSAEPMENAEPVNWKETVKQFFLPDPGHEKSYIIGIAIDSVFMLIWFLLVFLVVDPVIRAQIWYMPLLGIMGATVSMATPAGGGVFYFPALTLLNVSAAEAIAFNYATQTLSMGVFGTLNWLRKSRSSVVFWMCGWVVIWGWIGCALALFVFPVTADIALRIIFAVFSLLLMIYVIWGLKGGALKKQSGEIHRTLNSLVGLALSGFIGGVLLGWISVGIDITIFLILSALYKVDSRKATVTSILVIGWTSFLPLMYHIIDKKDVPYDLWIMVIGGSLIGARVGPLLNKLLGKKVMLIAFVILLAIEVIRTFVELVILPNVNSSDVE